MEVTTMTTTTIAKNDLVGLARDLNPELRKGLVGQVLQCYEDSFDVQFPAPSKKLYAQVAKQDLMFLAGPGSVKK
jgi:hypothetical protein